MLDWVSRLTRRGVTVGSLTLWIASAMVYADTLSSLSAAIDNGDRQAMQRIDAYLAQHPDDYQAQFLKARSHQQLGEHNAAIAAYQQLIAKYPNIPEAYNNLAAIYVAQGKLSEAQGLLEKAMRTHPGYAAVYDNLSRIYVEMARSSYGKALQLDADEKNITLRELKLASIDHQPVAPTTEPPAAAAAIDKHVPPQPESVEQDTQDIITTLQGWAAAWSEQATDVYFVFYTKDFAPQGMSRKHWEHERRQRLQKPDWIRIALSEFEVNRISDQEAQVELIQEYRASNYQDRTRKRLRLRQTPDGWRIAAEQSLATLN